MTDVNAEKAWTAELGKAYREWCFHDDASDPDEWDRAKIQESAFAWAWQSRDAEVESLRQQLALSAQDANDELSDALNQLAEQERINAEDRLALADAIKVANDEKRKANERDAVLASDWLSTVVQQAKAEQREEDARIAETQYFGGGNVGSANRWGAKQAAAAIRAAGGER